jgi:hypothetical protein
MLKTEISIYLALIALFWYNVAVMQWKPVQKIKREGRISAQRNGEGAVGTEQFI